MTASRSHESLVRLVHELRKLPKETECVEFKQNNDNPLEVGEYISALANSAALNGKSHAYVLWGIDNTSHNIVGTTFKPSTSRKGNEELESWLLRLLSPRIHFSFFELSIDGQNLVLLEIPRASHSPVRFNVQEYIRVGSYKKLLKDYPEKERKLWRIIDITPGKFYDKHISFDGYLEETGVDEN